MIHAGDIFESHDGRERVVVYLVQDREHPPLSAVFYERLSDGGGGSFLGPSAGPRFLLEYPTWIGRMRFQGAHQLYRKERERREHLEDRLAALEDLALEGGRARLSRGATTVNRVRAAFGLRKAPA